MKTTILFACLLIGTCSLHAQKISSMTPATSLSGTEMIPIVQSGSNKRMNPNLLREFIKTTIDSTQLEDEVLPLSVLWMGSDNRLHYISGDSTYIVAIASKSLTNSAPPPANLVVNGTFSTASDWDLYGTWVITGGVCSKPDNGGAGCLPLVQTLDYSKTYVFEYDLVSTGGEFWFYTGFGGAPYDGVHRTASGHYSEEIPTGASGNANALNFTCNWGFIGSVDNIVVYEKP